MKVRTRLYGIDLFRVISAFIIFVFHVHIHIGVSFGLANNFVGLGHIFMIAFFMLSGFSIFYTSNINQKKSTNLAGGGGGCVLIKKNNKYLSFVFCCTCFISSKNISYK